MTKKFSAILGALAVCSHASAAEPRDIGAIAANLTRTYVECAGFGGSFYWDEDRAKLDAVSNGQATRMYPMLSERYRNTPAFEEQLSNRPAALALCNERIKADRAAFLARLDEIAKRDAE